MAIIELTKENKPKLAVQVNNSLKYMNKDGELHDRTKQSALIDVVRTASSVARAEKGPVVISLSTENGYKNYFVNNNEQNDIVLAPMDKKLQGNKENFLVFNKKVNINDPDKYFYAIDKSSQKLVDSIKVVQTDKSNYLGVRVTLANDKLKAELSADKDLVAIIGKDKEEVLTKTQLEAKKKTKQEQDKNVIPLEVQDKDGNVIEQTTTPKTLNYVPKAEQKTQNQQQDLSK